MKTENERQSATGDGPSRAGARGRDKMEMGVYNTRTGKTLRSRARACEAFYDPAIDDEADDAVDYAMAETHGDPKFRSVWRFYCLQLGVNTFLDQLDVVLSCARLGEIWQPAKAFHARLRRIKDQLDKRGGAR